MNTQLLKLLKSYHTADPDENDMLAQTINFVQNNRDCFQRTLLTGHVTGSAWILNNEVTHTLLIHHRKLDKWFQPGGHCDGNHDVMRVAAKEAIEETGLAVIPVNENIFDIDIHEIPGRPGIPAHLHYDIRYVFKAPMTNEELVLNEEVKALRWIALGDVHRFNASRSIVRMVEKSRVSNTGAATIT
ncbi:MAG: NUDIX domain-containing protein, partial [Chitinophagaceae bacterium]